MNGRARLHYAAERNGTWKIGKDVVTKMTRTQDFISDEYDLLIEVTAYGRSTWGAFYRNGFASAIGCVT